MAMPAAAGLMWQLDRQDRRPQLQEVQVGILSLLATAGLTLRPNLQKVTATSHGRPPQVQEGQVVARKAQVVGRVEMFHQED